MKDHELVPYCLANDYVLMTIDDGDPRRLAAASGLHPGLILLACGGGYDRMVEIVTAAIDYVERMATGAGEGPATFMANKVVEVGLDGACQHHDLP